VVAGLLAGALGADTAGPDFYFWVLIPLQNLGHIGALALIARGRGFPDLAEALSFEVEPHHARWVMAGAAISIPLAWLAAGLRNLLGIEDETAQAIVEAVAETRGTTTMAAVVVGVAVLGPVVEEMIHRGLVYRMLVGKDRKPVMAVIVTSVLFSAIHLVDPSLYSAAGAVTLLVLFAFGLLLGILRARTGTLGPSIFAHSGFNLMTLVVLFFFPTPVAI
jgi:membrane protease YdiL (CAAX protease family)